MCVTYIFGVQPGIRYTVLRFTFSVSASEEVLNPNRTNPHPTQNPPHTVIHRSQQGLAEPKQTQSGGLPHALST
jgi:hypothetical protein